MTFNLSSRSLLSRHDLGRFSGETLFDRVARAVCEADCLPRKELYESWEVARRLRRRFRGGRVVDLACGHGLTAQLLLLLDSTSGLASATDAVLPASAARLQEVLALRFPRLQGRVQLLQGDLSAVELCAHDVVVSIHACGALTDVVLERAVAARARIGVLPCCHNRATCDSGGLEPWMPLDLAIDATRVLKLRAAGYQVHAQAIPSAITPKNRLLLAEPELP